eukprot:3432874-Ditylum_brightwellii.AAC.1
MPTACHDNAYSMTRGGMCCVMHTPRQSKSCGAVSCFATSTGEWCQDSVLSCYRRERMRKIFHGCYATSDQNVVCHACGMVGDA